MFLFLCVMTDLNSVNKFRVVYAKFIYYMYLIIEYLDLYTQYTDEMRENLSPVTLYMQHDTNLIPKVNLSDLLIC